MSGWNASGTGSEHAKTTVHDAPRRARSRIDDVVGQAKTGGCQPGSVSATGNGRICARRWAHRLWPVGPGLEYITSSLTPDKLDEETDKEEPDGDDRASHHIVHG